ncbi:MAG: hypothetical protein GF355_10545 [Candidatus Eisenbacteria bacterium]|nr:hypothetical protein [Candidatus Eisenbacteria bacterium]
MARSIAALIRHGDYRQPAGVPSAHLPYPLTGRGREQAAGAAREILELVADAQWRLCPIIDSSRMLRAWETAQELARVFHTDLEAEFAVEEFDALAERSVGSAANLTLDRIEEILRLDPRWDPPPVGWRRDSRYRLPLQGAESLLEAGGRVARHIEARMLDLDAGGESATVKLFVGHGGAFRHAALHLGLLSHDDVGRLSMYHCRPIVIERDSNGAWRHIAGEWKIRPGRAEPRD